MCRNKQRHTRRRVFEQCESRLCLSTVGFASHEIACCPTTGEVLTADLDSDGDLDVLSERDGGWYENVDGQGNSFNYQPLSTTSRVKATADLDNDGDADLLLAKHDFRSSIISILWQENVDGQGTVWGPERKIATMRGLFNHKVAAADMDGDGDVDVLLSVTGRPPCVFCEARQLSIIGVNKKRLSCHA